MPPLFGYHIPSFTFDGPADGLLDRVVELAVAAERAGFGLVTVMDHFYQIRGVGQETEPMLEAYSTLGALAARTSSVRLGTLVTGVTYRNPAILAKTVTTLDVISGGERYSASAPPGTRMSTVATGSTSRPSVSAWIGLTKRWPSAGRCSPRTEPRSEAGTIKWRAH